MIAPGSTRSLELAARVFGQADKEVRKEIAASTRQAGSWVKPLIAGHARSTIDNRYAASARVSPTANGVKIVVGGAGRIGTAPMRDMAGPIEFGADRNKRNTYTRSGARYRQHRVTRATQAQLPWRRPKGRIAYAALPDIAPRLASAWVRACLASADDINTNGGR